VIEGTKYKDLYVATEYMADADPSNPSNIRQFQSILCRNSTSALFGSLSCPVK